MSSWWRGTVLFFLTTAVIATSGCKTKEERVAEYYAQAQQLAAENDLPRARIAFRNVFKNDPNNFEARVEYAQLLLSEGAMRDASGQFLRLLEQDSTYLPARISIATIATEQFDWLTARKHMDIATAQAPDEPEVQALTAVLDYVDAVAGNDDNQVTVAVQRIIELDSDAAKLPLRRALIDGLQRLDQFDGALERVDASLERWPDDFRLHASRLRLLLDHGSDAEIEAQFLRMTALFRQSSDIRERFVNWYVERGALDKAETYLRNEAAGNGVGAELELVNFLTRHRGTEVARADLTRLVDGSVEPTLFRSMRAAIDFEAGLTEQAMDEMRAVIAESEPGIQQDSFRVLLTQMLRATDARTEAEEVIAQVTQRAPHRVDAAASHAELLLERGQIEKAIILLRAALDPGASDPKVLALLAEAHTMMQDEALAGRMLALAVEASGSDVGPSLTYGRYLEGNGSQGAAIEVLRRALRAAPGDIRLLTSLGEAYVDSEDYARAQEMITLLRDQARDAAKFAADRLEFTMLVAQGRLDVDAALLKAQNDGAAPVLAYAALVRAHLDTGQRETAVEILNRGLEQYPDNYPLLALSASLALAEGQADVAEATYRRLLKDAPDSEYLWLKLAETVATSDAGDRQIEVLDQALASLPDAPRLHWQRAVTFESLGQIDDAIAAYETLWRMDPSRVTVANNLASLLATHRDDAESLALAAEAAQVLDGTDIPHFQATQGWIAYRQGNVEAAVSLLVPAAAILADNAQVQLQTAQALIAAGQTDVARNHLSQVIALPDVSRADAARALLADLDVSNQSTINN